MIRIVTDTTANLPQHILDEFNIPVVPQYVHFGQDTARDYFDISPAEFYRRQKTTPELPKTSAPPPADFLPIFRSILDEDPAATILCIHPSTDVSGTIRSAEVAAMEFPGADIRIYDTRSVSLGLGLTVWHIAELVRAGAGIDTVMARLDYMRDSLKTLFVVETLDYLAKGGRIGRASHLLGTLLDIKPILALVDGVVESHSKARTRKRSVATIRDMVIEDADGRPNLQLGVGHAACEEEGRALAAELQTALNPQRALFVELGPSIGVHAGPGTLAVGWISLPE